MFSSFCCLEKQTDHGQEDSRNILKMTSHWKECVPVLCQLSKESIWVSTALQSHPHNSHDGSYCSRYSLLYSEHSRLQGFLQLCPPKTMWVCVILTQFGFTFIVFIHCKSVPRKGFDKADGCSEGSRSYGRKGTWLEVMETLLQSSLFWFWLKNTHWSIVVNEVGLSFGTQVGHNHLTMCLIAYWLHGGSFLGLQVEQQNLSKVKAISVTTFLVL